MDAKTISSREIIYDLLRIKETLRRSLGNANEFKPLLGALLDYNIGDGEDYRLPTVKDLVKLSGVKYDKIRKQLHKIYDRLIEMTESELSFSFNKVEYVFWAKGTKNSLVFNVKSLPVVPRVGEGIDLPYFRGYLGTGSFFVDSINHEFKEGKHRVVIHLKDGYYNPYWYFRKAQALEEGELGFDDLLNLNEYELKGKLKLGAYRFWQK